MLILVALTILFLFTGSASSQVSWPNCTARELDWTYNSISQNPCEVTAYMLSTCSGDGGFAFGPLPSGYVYTGPDGSDEDDSCKCNTITYSLLSACSACQGEGWVRWAEWAAGCDGILPPSTFPNPVPPEIRIPRWALIDVTLENNWNPNNSRTLGGSPEIGPGVLIASGPSTSSGSTTSSTGSSTAISTTSPSRFSSPASSTPTVTLTPQNSLSDTSRSKRAVLVGGIVGGIASLVISIVVVGIYCMRRRRSKAPSTSSEVETFMSNDATFAPSPMPHSPIITTRVYNPSDPTTFPPTREAPYVPEVSSRAIFGPHQRNGSTLRLEISQEPDYYPLPTASISSFRNYS